MLLIDTAQIDIAYLQALCADRCPESESLDFKRDAPGTRPEDKHELAKDVSAFANAGGGDLVYGIEECRGHASKLKPIEGELFDPFARRITQVLEGWVEPRITGIQIFHVSVDRGFVAVVRVPASYDGPHCIRKDTNRRFVMRNGAGTSDFTFDQLRGAFGRTASLVESAAEFIKTRQNAFDTLETPRQIGSGPVALLQIVPLAGLAGRQTIDMLTVHTNGPTMFRGNLWGGASREFNLDGVVVFSTSSQPAYSKIYRTGAMEAAQNIGEITPATGAHVEVTTISSKKMILSFREAVTSYLAAAKSWGLVGPAAISVALMGIEGLRLQTGDPYIEPKVAPIRSRNMALPPTWVQSLEQVDVDELLRPLMDNLWQGFDMERCPHFHISTGVCLLH